VTQRVPTAADVTILIPTLGRDVLRECVAAIEAGRLWPACLIVVDQGSRPAVRALLNDVRARSFETRWVPSTAIGKSAGLNRGFGLASTRFVAIVDDDCLVAHDWLERMADRLRRHPGAIVTGRVEAGRGEVNLALSTSREPAVQRRPRLQFDRLVGGNMGLSVEVFEKVGGFDEHLTVRNAEDPEYAYRALRAGVPIVYAPDVAVWHLGWRGADARAEQYRSYAISHGGFYGKYLRRGDLFIALRAAVHLVRALRRWMGGVVRREPDLARNGRAYVTGLLPGIVAGWRRRPS
jgi:GT2 family glycosyltransferase